MNTKPSRTLTSLFLVAVLIAHAPVLLAYAAAGALDPTFGTGGMVTTPFGDGDAIARATVLQPDGKIVVVGESYAFTTKKDITVMRYNDDGSRDTSFDGDGIATTDIGSQDNFGDAVALQADGKIVVTGHSWNGSNLDIVVVRYNKDGSLDTGFDGDTTMPNYPGDGKITTAIGSGKDGGTAVAIQSDGKIVVAGYSEGKAISNIAVVRYNADGSRDTSFDSDGIVTTSVGGGDAVGSGMVIQPDGKIVVAGWSSAGGKDSFAIVRYNMDGSLDTSFDRDGKVTVAGGSSTSIGSAVALQPDGKIVVAGYSRPSLKLEFAVMRFNPDGSLDTGFDVDGIVTTPIRNGDALGEAVTVQPDNKIVVAGLSDDGSVSGNTDFAVVRYNNDGSLDTGFDVDGIVTTEFTANSVYDDDGQAVAIQPDGKIVVAGTTAELGIKKRFAIARYDGGLVPGGSFVSVTASISLTAYEALVSLVAHNITFPDIVLLGADKLVDAADFAWQTSDQSPVAAGWHVTLEASDFSDGGQNTIPVAGFTVQMPNTAISTVNGNTPPVSQVTSPTALSPTGINLLAAAVGDGLGTYNFVPHFQLLVPGATLPGAYGTTVTVTIISGP